jgi:diguanylate cyclase (GGDEF)-like protein
MAGEIAQDAVGGSRSVGMDVVAEGDLGARAEGSANETAMMARSLGWLYVAGATIGSVSLLLPRAPHTNVGALAVNIGLAYIGGIVVLTVFPRLPAWSFHIALLAGTVLITRAVYYSGQGVSYYGIWYLWAALFGFSFFSRRQATMHVAIVGVAYGVVLAVRNEPVAQARWVTTIASLLIAGVFIDVLVHRVRRQRERAADNAENLAAVVDATQRIYQQPSAEATRLDLCETAAGVARADSAALWEPSADGQALRLATSTGDQAASGELPLSNSDEVPTGVTRAFTTRQASFASVAESDPSELNAGATGLTQYALWQPVLRDETPVAVLALYWQSQIPAPEENVRAAIVLLATQAAIAIERANLLARVERMARTDELTGLPNRRAWREALPRELARAKRDGWPLCVAILDVDGLKAVNDTYGHHAGDQLLKQNAASWSAALRPVDLLARYGGDEFAALLTGCHLEDAQQLIGRLVEATPEHRSFSVGVVQWDGVQDVDALVEQADARLYEAKAARTEPTVLTPR